MTVTAPPPASTSSPGMAPEEKKAAALTIGAGFLLGGPVIGIIAALAVGIEQAFIKSGWDKPGWFEGRPRLTAEQLAERRQQLAADAAQVLADLKQRAQARSALLEEHRQRLRDWIDNNRDGDKPDRPDGSVRNPWEFLKDTVAKSKAGYRLFDDKMARANEKITGTYPAIGAFFRDLWNFLTGFAEGARAGWRQWQEQQRPGKRSAQPDEQSPEPDERGTEDFAAEALDGPEPDFVYEPGAAGSPLADPVVTGGPAAAVLDADEALPLGPAGPGERIIEGDVMTADGTTVLPSGETPPRRGPQGETNLDFILQLFAPIPPLLASVERQLPDLQGSQRVVARRLHRIRSLAGIYPVPMVVWELLAEAGRMAQVLQRGLRLVGENNATAIQLGEQALVSLQPAQEHLQQVHREGASGEVFANAAEAGA